MNSINDFNMDFDLGVEINRNPKQLDEPPIKKRDYKKARTQNVKCLVRNDKNIFRRAFSETQLLDVVGINFKEGENYHCLTGGDVDGLSFLKVVLRQQDLEYCLLSTWCMAIDDVLQIKEWIEKGKIKKLDAFVGEIFKGSYATEYIKLKEIIEPTGGRVVVFRNHSKTFAGYGDKFYFGIQSSANINTNPRTENGCITIGKDIFDFYYDFYHKIKGLGE